MESFLVLLLAHLMADFPLQTNRIFRMKLAGNRGLALHVSIHLLVVALLVQRSWQQWSLLLVLGAVHFAIDWTKLRMQHPQQPELPGFLLDQLAHLVTIGMLAAWRSELTAVLPVGLLLPAILLALIPALLTLFWVWANDLCQSRQRVECHGLVWACRRLLPISQQMGWAIALAVAAASILV